MILVAALLVLAAVGLLVAGLAQGSATLLWVSFAASALAAVVLAVSELRRRRQNRQDGAVPTTARSRTPTAAPARDEDLEVRRAVPPPVPPSSPLIPRVAGPVPGATAASGLGELARTTVTGPGMPAEQPAVARWQEELPTGALPAHDRAGGGVLRDAAAQARPPATVGAHTGGHSAIPADGEPPVEEVEVTDLLLVLDLTDEVLVVDEHPRYHLAGCPQLTGVATIPLPMVEARTDGFSPCGTCAPDRTLAERERMRRAG